MTTKREHRLRRLEAAASNCEPAVSITDQEMAERVYALFQSAEAHGHTPESAMIAEIFERARERQAAASLLADQISTDLHD